MSKKQPKLTPVFPPHIKPVHEGPYKVGKVKGNGAAGHAYLRSAAGFAYFDGYGWGVSASTAQEAVDAYRLYGTELGEQEKPWRGLAEKPHA